MGCTTGKTGHSNNNNLVCNNDGICGPGENALNCMDCAGVQCCIGCITGEVHDFLVAELFIPHTDEDALQCGVDLDGDGGVDNRLGSILSYWVDMVGDLDINAEMNRAIREGWLLLVHRIYLDQWESDDEMIFQMLAARVLDDATPLFQGNDTMGLDASAMNDFFLCGLLRNDIFEVGPNNLRLIISLPLLGQLDLTLARAMIKGRGLETGLEDVVIGGGISQRELETRLYPLFVDWMNSEITGDPTGLRTSRLLHWLDDRCEPSVEGCDPLPVDCAPDGEISLDELLCNADLSDIMARDVDLSYDGQNDHISIGFKIVRAVPASLVEK